MPLAPPTTHGRRYLESPGLCRPDHLFPFLEIRDLCRRTRQFTGKPAGLSGLDRDDPGLRRVFRVARSAQSFLLVPVRGWTADQLELFRGYGVISASLVVLDLLFSTCQYNGIQKYYGL